MYSSENMKLLELCFDTNEGDNVRNKEQELEWQNIIKTTQQDVKKHFPEIYGSIEFGAYIKPENYFASYIFRTNALLKAAKQNELMKSINSYHRRQLEKNNYPIQGIKDCLFASQEECEKECNGNWYYYYK